MNPRAIPMQSFIPRPTFYPTPSYPVNPAFKTPRKPTTKSPDFITALWNVLKTCISDPKVTFFLVVATAVALSHIKYADDSILDSVVTYLKEHSSTEKLGDFVEKYEAKIVGFFIFLPLVFFVKNENRVLLIAVIGAWLVFSPVVEIYQYAVQAVLTLFYFRMKGTDHRVTIILIAVGLYVGGLLMSSPTPTASGISNSAGRTGSTSNLG